MIKPVFVWDCSTSCVECDALRVQNRQKKLYNRKKKKKNHYFFFSFIFVIHSSSLFLCFSTIKSQKTATSKRGKKRTTVKKKKRLQKGKSTYPHRKKSLLFREANKKNCFSPCWAFFYMCWFGFCEGEMVVFL